MLEHTRYASRLATLLALLLTLAAPIAAIETPAGGSFADDLAFDHPDMYVLNYYLGLNELSPLVGAALQADLLALGVPSTHGFYDLRAGRWGSLILTFPLIPGDGVGNTLSWSGLGAAAPQTAAELEALTGQAFGTFLQVFSAQLGIDPAELANVKVTSLEDGRVIQINAGRAVGGVPVEGALVHGVVNNGNLILFGTRNWGDVAASTTPAISGAEALAAVDLYTTPVPQTAKMREPTLTLYPLKNGDEPSEALLGAGFAHRLAWDVQLGFDGDHGTWRALVDAQTGEVFSFADQNHYATRKVTGGVYPISNDGFSTNGIPDGVEQAGWPMPFADVTFGGAAGSPDTFTNSSGVVSCVDGPIATGLSGRYVSINDNCGAASESAASGDLDLGTSGGTDCTVPAGGSAGNTHSARSGFYEVARIQEQARSWLPENSWLQDQLTANMNIDDSCNAFWNGSTINFYRSGGGCGNTGEIAAVFDHEWGHGMDANDQMPGISTPGEAPADHAAIFRLNTSCIGRGFFQSGTCGGQGDPCLECTGVREVDWAKRASGMPHNVTWVQQPVETPVDGPLAPRGGCVGAGVAIPVLQTGPCLQSTHCEGSVVSEAIWDLIHRDLAGAPYNLDVNTRLNLVTRLGYLGGTNVNFWYQCVATPEGGTAGCNSDGGYMNYLAIDDDNGDLTDGTPHMSAIHAAFARHQMACPTPEVTDSGCSSVPATPSVTVQQLDNSAKVTWSAVPGADSYWVFRADGLNGCDFGKERIAVTSGTELVDTALVNGREYYYTVEAVGANDSCRSAASSCQAVTPGPGANLQISEGSAAVSGLSGDGDPFVDNCETVRVTFDVENSGNLPLTNVRITGVDSPSHPGVTATSSLPATLAASLADCETATGSFDLYADGIAADDTIVLEVTLLADEMAVARTETIELRNGESDFVATPSRTYAFNADGDLEGWEVVSGTFSQLPGGPPAVDPGGSFLTSSSFQDNACDAIQSPLVRLSPTSTLSLWNQFSIEPPLAAFGDVFYDRANVGVLEADSGVRTTVDPDGGRAYNASGPNGVCFTAGENGWADAAGTWDQSTWSAAALNTSAYAGEQVRIHVAYGTDPTASLAGFQFDYVTLTDVEIQGADGQSDTCQPVDPPVCGDLDDADSAVEYQTGWHRRTDGGSNGGYHRRMGSHNTGNGNGSTPIVRLVFEGDEVTYHYVMSDRGGAADITIDGSLVETLTYGANQPGQENPTFGHSRTYSGLGAGSHELVIEHKYGAVYVDGFTIACGGGAGADPAASSFRSETSTSSGSWTEGPVLTRTVEVGSADEHVSAVVEGSLLPVTVRILDPSGGLLAEGASLLGGVTSGAESATAGTGTYTVQVLYVPGAFDNVEISIAKTVANP